MAEVGSEAKGHTSPLLHWKIAHCGLERHPVRGVRAPRRLAVGFVARLAYPVASAGSDRAQVLVVADAA
jgi:hypothetical protein